MTKSKIKKVYGILLIIVLVILDQFTKIEAVKYLQNNADFIIISGVLQFHYLENIGAAFSILQGQQLFFKILTPILLIILFYTYCVLPENKKNAILKYIILFIIAGAIGNYIDRIRFEYVIDFIYFSLIDFPVFNVADCYVTCSVFVLIITIIFYYKDEDLDAVKNAFLRKNK